MNRVEQIVEPRKSKDAAWRSSSDLWLNAAYESLVESGIDAVRIQLLAKRIGISRGSFYWAFKDREALLDALIELWKSKNTENLVRQSRAYAETIEEGLLNVFDCWLDRNLFDSELDFAVRGWGLQSDMVLKSIEEADRTRIAALKALFERFGMEELMADVSARALYQGQIGYISTQRTEDIDIRMSKVPLYIKLFTGQRPTTSEMNRFHARHGYSVKG